MAFNTQREAQKALVQKAVASSQTPEQFHASLTETLQEGPCDKSLLALVFREVLQDEMKTLPDKGTPNKAIENLISLGIWCSHHKLLGEAAVVTFLEDMLDYQTVNGLEKIFPFVRENLRKVVKSKLFVPVTHKELLKICNTLLKRLSKTTHTKFCGQILMLLANALPLDHRSGLNISGALNTGNVTPIQPEPGTKDSNDEKDEKQPNSNRMQIEEKTEEISSDADGVDYASYKSLWELQKYFKEPKLLSDATKFAKFSTDLNKVLDMFEQNKVEYVPENPTDTDTFYPKYLTGIQLLKLQLQDSVFRLNLLTQCDILFAFLDTQMTNKKMSARIKPSLPASSENQLRSLRHRVKKMLNSTPPDGKEYSSRLHSILKREGYWSLWKDDACKPIVSKKPPADLSKPLEFDAAKLKSQIKIYERARPMRGKFLFNRNTSKSMCMGDPILNSLWDMTENNLDMLTDEDRFFVPEVKEWLMKVVNDEEDKDLSVGLRNNPTYVSRTLKLCARDRSAFNNFLKCRGSLEDKQHTHWIEELATGKKPAPKILQKGDPKRTPKTKVGETPKNGDIKKIEKAVGNKKKDTQDKVEKGGNMGAKEGNVTKGGATAIQKGKDKSTKKANSATKASDISKKRKAEVKPITTGDATKTEGAARSKAKPKPKPKQRVRINRDELSKKGDPPQSNRPSKRPRKGSK